MPHQKNDTVLVLPSWYPSKVDPFNGDFIQRHVQALATQYTQFVIYVVKDDKRMVTNDIKEEGAVFNNYTELIIYYASFRTGIGFIDRVLSHLKYIRTYKKAINKYLYNNKSLLVHVHVAMKAGILALWVKQKYNIPFVVTEHWTGYYKQSIPNIFQQNIYLQNTTKKILQNAAAFFPVSRDLGKTISETFANVPYEVISNTVDTDHFYYKPLLSQRFRFIHPSYLNYQKNPERILVACRILLDKGLDFELLFLGRRDEDLMTDSKAYGMDKNIFFQTAVPYKEVAIEMQHSNALLLFSRFENLPCVVLEALCCGLPVISSRVGGIPEVVDESNGLLVENGSIHQLVDAMEKMIVNYANYKKEQISKNATAKFNYKEIGKQYFDAFKKVKL